MLRKKKNQKAVRQENLEGRFRNARRNFVFLLLHNIVLGFASSSLLGSDMAFGRLGSCGF